jgi:vanillate O-demethylase ferredoxin subunit
MRAAPDWIEAQVAATDDIATEIRQIRLVPQACFRPAPIGSHIDVQVPIGDLVRTRSYSVVDDRDGAWTIAVRQLPNSRGGSRFMAALTRGDTIRITAPQSHFDLSPGRPHYLLIAGGIGVTPLISMARALATHPGTRMLYAGRSRAHMPYLDRLTTLLGDRLTIFSNAESTRINLSAALASLHPEGEAYLCGPAPMLEAARQAWRAAARSPALLRFETFGSGGLRDPEPFSVHVRDHGVTLAVPRNASLLDTLARAGIDVAQDCLRGECGLCAVDVIGPAELDHRDVFLSEAQRTEGSRLCVCVSRAVGQITIDTGFRPALAREAARKEGLLF